MVLVESENLDAPIFSPATKAETGMMKTSRSRACANFGNDGREKLESMARTVYNFGERISRPIRHHQFADTEVSSSECLPTAASSDRR